jgi:Stage II sporulation protein E (SpoIIE)
MIPVRKRLLSLVFFYVFFPLFLVLCWVNLSFYRATQAEGENQMNSLAGIASAQLTMLFREVAREAEAFAQQPLLARKLVESSEGLKHLRPANPGAPVTEDQMSALFNFARSSHPEMRDFVLIDNLGQPVDASGATPKPDYSKEDWFRTLFTDPDIGSVILPISSNDTFSVAAVVKDFGRPGDNRLGIVLSSVSVKVMMGGLPPGLVPDGEGFALLVPGKWHLLGGHGMKEEEMSALIGFIRNRSALEGRFAGIAFRVFPGAKELGTSGKTNLVVMRKNAEATGRANFRMLLVLSLSLLALFLITTLAHLSVKRINQDTEDLVNAGTWLLHQVRGEDKVPASLLTGLTNNSLHDEILSWQAGYKQSIADDIEAYAFENKRDLFLARDFQLAYMARPFPPIPAMPLPGRLRLKFAHRYKPALAIGGDFFEILNLTPETGGVFIADVMGHGTRSALITSILRSILADSKPQGGNARNFLRETNRKFSAILNSINMDIPLFASAFYFVADCTARVATFSTAGHPAPFHLRRQSNLLETLKVSEPHGPALGIMPDEDYTGGSSRLMPGDTFIFYTDGVYECFNPRGEEFGLQNLEKTIRRLMHRSPDEILQGIMDALADFSGGTILHDDICMLAVEVEEDLPTLNARGTAAGA